MSNTVCSTIDKMDKIPWADAAAELKNKGVSAAVIARIGEEIVGHQSDGKEGKGKDNEEDEYRKDGEDSKADQSATLLQGLQTRHAHNGRILPLLSEMSVLFANLHSLDVPDHFLKFDLSLARGMGYYTGVIFEAIITDPALKIGSIAAGGRYAVASLLHAKG